MDYGLDIYKNIILRNDEECINVGTNPKGVNPFQNEWLIVEQNPTSLVSGLDQKQKKRWVFWSS